MKRIPRDPEKFEVIDLYDSIGKKLDLKLHDETSERKFLESIRLSLRHNKTPNILHGLRTEAMFGYVAASLRQSAVVKKEDCGEIFLESTDAMVPDYRVVTERGEQFLVEVKNCHKTDPSAKYSIKAAYFEGLQKYASLLNLEVKLAIYWSRWNKWVLISLSDLRRQGSSYLTTFHDTCKQNQMAILGDETIGTAPPLVVRFLTDPDKPRRVTDDGQVEFTVGRIELCCAGQLVTRKEEQNIILYFLLYGDWPIGEPQASIENGQLIAVEYSAEPIEKTPEQRFELIGSLSGMISRHYNELTAPAGKIEKLAPSLEPDSLGTDIPADYRGKELPLWRFIQQPAAGSNHES